MRPAVQIGAVLTAILFLLPASALAQDEPTSFKDVCEFIAYHQSQNSFPTAPPRSYPTPSGNKFLQYYFVHFGHFDLDGDRIPETITHNEFNGTMRGDSYVLTLSSAPSGGTPPRAAGVIPDGIPPNIWARYDHNGPNGFGEAWLPYGDRFYDVNFSDEGGAFVQDAQYFTRGGTEHFACIFDNNVTEQFWQPEWQNGNKAFKADADKLCPFSGSADAKPVEIPAAERLPESVGAKIRPFEMVGGTLLPDCKYAVTPDCKDIWHVDFDNDGVMDRLLKVSGESGAGRGCNLEFFVLLNSKNEIAKGEKQKLLLKLQDVDLSDAYPVRPCELSYHWLKAGERTILERLPRQWGEGSKPQLTTTLVRDFYMARNGQSARICFATFKVAAKVVFDAVPKVEAIRPRSPQ